MATFRYFADINGETVQPLQRLSRRPHLHEGRALHRNSAGWLTDQRNSQDRAQTEPITAQVRRPLPQRHWLSVRMLMRREEPRRR